MSGKTLYSIDMKKLIPATILFLCSLISFAQVPFGQDVILYQQSGVNQRNAVVTSAFNGWLYAAYTTVNSALNEGGITILKSTDNGFNWNVMDSYTPTDVRYRDVEIEVAGTDTNDLKLFLAAIREDVTAGTYLVFLDEYNATTGDFIGSNFNKSSGIRQIYDIDLATDNLSPAVGSSPYSIGILYSVSGPLRDSILFYSSVDGGATFPNKQIVATTSSYNRKVSLAYGKSNSGSNGRYFAVWEQIAAAGNRNGNVYYSRCQTTVNGSWITPVNIDSISSAAAGVTRNPRIACSISDVDADSGGVSALILVDRDFNGDASDYDVLGFYNKIAHFTSNFTRLDVMNSGSSNDMQSDIVYNPTDSVFSVVYVDSTTHELVYTSKHFNLPNPSTWTTLSATLNDNPTATRNAFPRIAWHNSPDGAAIVWNDEGAGGNGVAMFDAEYFNLYVSTPSETPQTFDVTVFPNPSADWMNIQLDLDQQSDIEMRIMDISGRVVSQLYQTAVAGTTTIPVNVSDLNAGNYFIHLLINGEPYTQKIVVVH